jgi:phosphatidylethanolamine/phosphatidyl-N-methylethanolamine N-methyltransferase
MTVEAVYERLAPVYDVIYGALLQPGRRCAISRLAPRPGESILEVGVGTGLSARHYPPGCLVVGVDLSAPMLERARARLARRAARHVRLCRMDATRLAFADAQFDAVYAPYVLNVVGDPVKLAHEMLRVCRPAGRLILLNHFDDGAAGSDLVDRLVGRLAKQISGVNWDLNLERFLEQTDLRAVSVERVNLPRVSSVVVCRRR